jgi:hypothetical protein
VSTPIKKPGTPGIDRAVTQMFHCLLNVKHSLRGIFRRQHLNFLTINIITGFQKQLKLIFDSIFLKLLSPRAKKLAAMADENFKCEITPF